MNSPPAFSDIELILSDVDGVLSDGGIIFNNQGIEMKLPPGIPRCLSDRNDIQLCASQFPFHGLTQKLTPQSRSLMIIHRQGVHNELSRNAERM